jgi:dolichyl-phosphate beta-glucosyltransferase
LAETHLAIVVPSYNEEERLGPTLQAMAEFLRSQDYTWTIIVVNDGSRDRTLEVARQASAEEPRIRVIDSQPNRGKGHAVRVGMMASEAEWTLMSDADLATPIEELLKLQAAAKGKDIVIGSRPLKESRLEVRQPLWREMGGRGFNLLIQSLGIWGIQDTQCGFKLFSRRCVHDVFSRCKINGFGFDIEALMVAKDLGCSIAEVGVRWRHVEGSKFDPLKEAPRMVRELVQLRLVGRRKRLTLNPESLPPTRNPQE